LNLTAVRIWFVTRKGHEKKNKRNYKQAACRLVGPRERLKIET